MAKVKRTREELNQLEEEAFDRVWADRSFPCPGHPDIEADRQKALRRVAEKYDDIHLYEENGQAIGIYTDEDNADWYHGFWSGILASLRWLDRDPEDYNDSRRWDLDT